MLPAAATLCTEDVSADDTLFASPNTQTKGTPEKKTHLEEPGDTRPVARHLVESRWNRQVEECSTGEKMTAE